MARTLSEKEIIKIVQAPKNRDSVLLGGNYESRLRVFTQPLFKEELYKEYGYTELLNSMRGELHPDKYAKTLNHFNYPLPIVNITKDIIGDLDKVFDGRNANFSIRGNTKSLESKVEYLLDRAKVRTYIEKTGRKVFKDAPQTIVVVDKNEKGEAYLVTVPTSNLIGYNEDEEGNITYIVFEHSEYINEINKKVKRIAFYDDTNYRVVEVVDGTYTVVTDNPHDIGYCPASFFVHSKLSEKSCNRFNPFAAVLANLSNWTLRDVYLKYASLYGTYPVVEMAKIACEDDNCVNGMVSVPLSDGGMSKPIECSTCSSSKLIGAGTVVMVDAATYNDEKDVSGLFRFVSPDINNIKFEAERQTERANTIKRNTTGVDYVMEKEAVNADQVRSIMEDRRKPLLFLAMQLNIIHKWIVATMAKAELNADVSIHVNYGTEWFLLSEGDIQKLFLDSKLSGMPESELDNLYKLLIETKYKGNPEVVRKLEIENSLNPAPYSSVAECYEKAKNGVMSMDDLAVKANFTKYIKRFEREHGSLVAFGEDAIEQGRMSYDSKINTIYNTLLKYVKDEQIGANSAKPIEQQGSSTTDNGQA